MKKEEKLNRFIEKAKKIHGDKYDYSKVVYVNNSTNIIIICSIHGEFEKTPLHHLRNQGCQKCSGYKKLTTEEFIIKAKEIHGDKYDYSKVNYINNATNIIIICPIHGEFTQTPNSHLSGTQCPKCRGARYKKISYEKAVELIKPFKFKTLNEYKQWYDENLVFCRTNGIPKRPTMAYKNDGWVDVGHWLGNSNYNRNYNQTHYTTKRNKTISYNDAKNIIKQFNIKNRLEYFNWWDNNADFCRENGIPKYPEHAYNINKKNWLI